MAASFLSLLIVYLIVIFATLPFLPDLVTSLTAHLGRGALFGMLYAGLTVIAVVPVLRLLLPPRPPPPRPQIAYALLLFGALLTALTLASSPIGRIHLAEYGILGVLLVRTLEERGASRPYAKAFILAGCIGLADETVQHFLPTRVFDWYDVALNTAASLLGVLAAAWWRWTGELRVWIAPVKAGPGGTEPDRDRG